ncbi:hypothetical protein LIER_00127 [Lithospermum erythrorhizon]|uniref:Uncharacterized protein n=1 Tax=Lithospermum erythrorhizon TaxID=34254 RepID=A0AAV3NGA8_LITER
MRWHKYWFLTKDVFSDEVRSSFSIIHTILEYEETSELAEGLKKLEGGFPQTLALDVFYDPDVLVKAGLSKGVNNFPNTDLDYPRLYLYSNRLPCRRDVEELHAEAFGIGGSWNKPLKPLRSLLLPPNQGGRSSLSLRLNDSSQCDDEVAHLKDALASTEKERDEALSQINELTDLCEKQRSDREKLLADARETSEVYKSEGERLKQHIRDLQGQVEDLTFDFTESQDTVRRFTNKCGDMEVKIVDLHRALDNSIEGFKCREEYRILLKGDTATLLRSFCPKVATNYPGISFHFTNFVTTLGEDYVVSLFEELLEEEPTDSSECDASEDEAFDES